MTKGEVYAGIMRTQAMCSDLMRTLLYVERSVVYDFYDDNVDIENEKFTKKLNAVNAFFDEILNSSEEFLMDLDGDDLLSDVENTETEQ